MKKKEMKSEKRRKFGKIWIFAVLFVTLAFVSIGAASASIIYVPSDYAKIQWAGSAATNSLNDKDSIIINTETTTSNTGILTVYAVSSEAISEQPFNYTITATGTENKVVYPDQSFTWTVTGTGTETWYTFPNQNFIWTVTGTGTETWYEQMPDEGDPADYGFYQSGGVWYKDGKQVTQSGVSEFRVIGGKPFWKYGGRYYYNNMVGSSTLPDRWGHMGKVTQSGVTCFCVVEGKAFWKYGGRYYRNNLVGYDCLGWPCDVGWDGTWGHMGRVTQSGVSEFRIYDEEPYWKYFSKCYRNTLVSYDCPGWPCNAGWDGTWDNIKEMSCPLPSPDVSIDPCAFGSHTATRTATDSGSGAVKKIDGKKFISTFSAMPQPQQGGTISGVTYSISDDNANVNTWISGNSVYASTSYSETHTVTRAATDSGSGTVNKLEGDKDMGTFSAYPQPEQGGTISRVTYSISDNNPEVDTWISGSHVYARTDYSEIQTVPWSGTETGNSSVNASEGDKYITTSTLVAPNDDTAWSVSDDSDYVETWMNGNELYACVISAVLPVHNLNTGLNYSTIQAAIDAAETMDGHTIIVDAGTYYETVNVNKVLTLRGMGMPVVDAGGSGSAITLSVDEITLAGFKGTNSGSLGHDAGIKVTSNNNVINDNIASNNAVGIFLYFSNYNTLNGNNASANNLYGIFLDSSSYNTLKNNTANMMGNSGISIIDSSNNNTLSNNIAFYNYVGIQLYTSSNNILNGNTASLNYICGISISLSSYNNMLCGNNASNNAEGICLHDSSNNTLIGNTASNNSVDGIYIDSFSYNTLTSNDASNNVYGIFSIDSHNNTLKDNNVSNNNYCGIYLYSSNGNTIYNNYFNNTNNAWDNGTNIWNTTKTNGTNIIGGPYLGGNYWSDYTGADLDGDGLGDTILPYNSGGTIANGGDYLPLIAAPINNPPIASFTFSPVTPLVDEAITFNASNSTDPDGTIVLYEWNFGDGNITNTTDQLITYSYALAADYNVALTVTDNEGANDTDTKTIVVTSDRFQWAKFWGGSEDEHGKGIFISDGNIYVSGSTWSFGAGRNDALLLKYDLSGNEIWNKTWGGSHYDRASRIHVSDSNIYVAGSTFSFAYDPVGDLEDDAAILKYNPSGDLLWYRTWGNYPGYSGYDSFNDAFAVGNDIYAVGSSEFGWGNRVLLLQKYDVEGNLVWTRFWGPVGSGWPNGLHTVGQQLVVLGSDIYVVGYTQSVMGAPYDAVIIKYDSSGNLIWNRTWSGTAREFACGVVVSGTGIYVVGYTNSSGAGGYDVFLLKYASAGNLLWNTTWGGSEDDFGYDIFISDNLIYIAGSTKSFGAGGEDAFILKGDASGNFMWHETWGGVSDDLANGLFVSGSDIFATGMTRSFGAGNSDIFLLKYNEVEKSDIVISKIWVNLSDNCTICYNVTNIGIGTARAGHNTTLFVEGDEVAYDHVPVPLAPNASHIGCFNYTWTYTPPEDNITVCADSNNTVEESDETNNCLTNIWMCGDVNGDHTVNVVDVLHVYKRALDPGYPLDLPWAGDVNRDGNINVVDVLHIYRRALDPSYDLNCCCEQVIE